MWFNFYSAHTSGLVNGSWEADFETHGDRKKRAQRINLGLVWHLWFAFLYLSEASCCQRNRQESDHCPFFSLKKSQVLWSLKKGCVFLCAFKKTILLCQVRGWIMLGSVTFIFRNRSLFLTNEYFKTLRLLLTMLVQNCWTFPTFLWF